MCQFCSQNTAGFDYKIKVKDSEVKICPNCIGQQIVTGNIRSWLVADPNVASEITGHIGAVTIIPPVAKKPYTLSIGEAIRFLSNSLLPNEYDILVRCHGEEFNLHDDFYYVETESGHFMGLATNSMDGEKYVADLRTYAQTLDTPAQQEIEKFISKMYREYA